MCELTIRGQTTKQANNGDQMFNFNPPAPRPAQVPAATPVPQSPFGGPPSAPVGPIDTASALQGFGEAPIDVRDPFLPIGYAGEIQIDKVEGKPASRYVGRAIYISCTVTRIAATGGPCPAPVPKGASMLPAVVGGKHTIRIDGFDKPDAQKFAFSDLKTFLIAALECKGLTAERAAALPAEQWNKMGHAAFTGAITSEVAGHKILVSVTKVDTKNGFAKQKTSFYPPSAAL